jgi:outer membrane protein assembly factor BamA
MPVRRVAPWVAVVLVLLCAAAAGADVGDYLGKSVASVAMTSDGRSLADSKLEDLIVTRVGQPLRLVDVRESIAHLYSLGRFEDVRVHAETAGGAVSLTYELVPRPVVAGIRFVGLDRAADVKTRDLRQAITARFGTVPRGGRNPEIAVAIEDALRQAGYLHAVVVPRTDVVQGRSTLVFAVELGARAHIGAIALEGAPGMPGPEFLRKRGVATGAPSTTIFASSFGRKNSSTTRTVWPASDGAIVTSRSRRLPGAIS